jgi:hypothetical protein
MNIVRTVSACLLFISLEVQGGRPPLGASGRSKPVEPPVKLETDGSLVFATNKLRVDADGAPNSYRVDGRGLSYTCDGVAAIVNGAALTTDDENWEEQCKSAWRTAEATGDYKGVRIFGFSHDPLTNKPIRQKDDDPLPDAAFRTETTLHVAGARSGTQSEFVDATKIPYVVLPSSFEKKYRVVPGELAMVYRPKNGAVAFAVYGDSGRLGEGSVKLHFVLGGEPIVCSYGVDRASNNIEDEVWTVIFARVTVDTGLDATAWNARIQDAGLKALDRWGGTARLKKMAGGNPAVRAITPSGSDRLTPCGG